MTASSALLLLALTTTHADPKTKSPWLTDYAQALKQARELDRPVFVVFRCEH